MNDFNNLSCGRTILQFDVRTHPLGQLRNTRNQLFFVCDYAVPSTENDKGDSASNRATATERLLRDVCTRPVAIRSRDNQSI